VVSHTRCAVVRERLLSSGRIELATGSYLGLAFCRLLALGLGWLEATSCGALWLSRHRSRGLTTGYSIRCHPSTSCGGAYDSVLVGPRLHGLATGGFGDSFVLLPRILWCGWVSFARAFLLGRLSQVKFLLSTQIQNSPPLVPGAGSLRRRQNLNHPGAR
jgi:hypothetical protein